MKSLKETINEDFKLNGKHKIVSHKNALLLEEDPVQALCRMIFDKLYDMWSNRRTYKKSINIYDLFNRLTSDENYKDAISELFAIHLQDEENDITEDDILEVYKKNENAINKFILWSTVEIINGINPSHTLDEEFNKLYNKYVKR